MALDVRNDSILAVGREAKEYLGRTPECIRAVRPLKDSIIANLKITKAMIAYFIRKTITGRRFARPRMAICVPAGITQVEKRAVIESALQAGVREVRLIEEPMAAAIGAGLPIHEPRGNMVVDIGDGSLAALRTRSGIFHSLCLPSYDSVAKTAYTKPTKP